MSLYIRVVIAIAVATTVALYDILLIDGLFVVRLVALVKISHETHSQH
jgi:hypothetical protein